MNNQEQNWTNLFGGLPAEGISWYGTWTKYSTALEVLTSFQGERNFVPNENYTVITHTNNYTYADGHKEQQQWQIDKRSCNHPDGMTHPAFSSTAKALSFGKGATVSMRKILEQGKYFGAELFFQHQDWRTSVVISYGENGDLAALFQIREHQNSFPEQPPVVKIENISGNWWGTKQSMTPDLKTSNIEAITGLAIDPTQGQNENFFLPDRVILNCPKQVKLGEAFELVAGKMLADHLYKRLTVKYDQTGAFSQLISEVFNRD